MTIAQPYIDPKDFILHATLFESFMEWYNDQARERRKNGERVQLIRGTHRETYFALVRMYMKQLKADAKVFHDTPELMAVQVGKLNNLYTNRLDFFNETRKDGTTFYRHLQRFMEMGIVKAKIFHGTRADFEVELNPDFFLVRDAKNPAYRPTSQWLQIALSSSGLNAKCTPLTIGEMNINKEIKGVNKETSLDEQNATEQKTNMIEMNEGECLENNLKVQEHSSNSPDSNTPPVPARPPMTTEQRAEADIKRYKFATARAVVMFAIEKLWPDMRLWTNERGENHISIGEIDRTIEHVYEWYFAKVDNVPSMIDNRLEFSKRAIIKSLRNLQNNGYRAKPYERHRTDLKEWFVNPYTYFHPDYTKGFNNAVKWMHEDWQKKLPKIARRKAQKAVDAAVKQYHKQSGHNPKTGYNRSGYAEYRRQESYVRNNYPQLLSEFLNRTLTNKPATV